MAMVMAFAVATSNDCGIHKPLDEERICTCRGCKICFRYMFRRFLAILCKWILLLGELICNKHDLEDCNSKISDV